uniref:Uncharacterized protein n=1 Tax=viral metagenome TaxID=1070528 RepID=A0A6C0LSK6_9ZZZZ
MSKKLKFNRFKLNKLNKLSYYSMLREILLDFISGLIDSIRLNLIFQQIKNNQKIRTLFLNYVKINALVYFIPHILTYFNLHQFIFKYIFEYTTALIIFIYNLFYNIDLLNSINYIKIKTNIKMGSLDKTPLIITMIIYQFTIYIATEIIKIILHDNLWFLTIFINTVILMLYHSFYCFNSLWYLLNFDSHKILDITEKIWPYYLGYGMIATILYVHQFNFIMHAIYNVYMTIIILLPFLINIKLPSINQSYMKISMKPFTLLTKSMIYSLHYLYRFYVFSNNMLRN